jgi:hypothetical protein
MKHQSIVCFTEVLIVLAGLSACSKAIAQTPTSRKCEESGTHLTYTLKISGMNLQDVKDAGLAFERSPQPPITVGQEGFATQLSQQSSASVVSPGILEVSVAISPRTAEGEYRLTQVDISNGPGGAGGQSFRPPFGFPGPAPIMVCNSKRFGPYQLDGVTKKP